MKIAIIFLVSLLAFQLVEALDSNHLRSAVISSAELLSVVYIMNNLAVLVK